MASDVRDPIQGRSRVGVVGYMHGSGTMWRCYANTEWIEVFTVRYRSREVHLTIQYLGVASGKTARAGTGSLYTDVRPIWSTNTPSTANQGEGFRLTPRDVDQPLAIRPPLYLLVLRPTPKLAYRPLPLPLPGFQAFIGSIAFDDARAHFDRLGRLDILDYLPVSPHFDLSPPCFEQSVVHVCKEFVVWFLGLRLDHAGERSVEYARVGMGQGRCDRGQGTGFEWCVKWV